MTNMGESRGLNSNQIKLMAILTMTIDHLAWTIWPGQDMHWWVILIHILTRITPGIMWFFIVEGYYHTHSIQKYLLRLFVFAVISHFAFTFAFQIPMIPFTSGFFDQTSIGWALFCGLLSLCVIDAGSIPVWGKVLLVLGLCAVSLPADWSCATVPAIVGIRLCRGSFRNQMVCMMGAVSLYAAVAFIFGNKVYALIQLSAALAIPLLWLYNGERGKWKGMKWLFYFYYPGHFVLLGILRILLRG